MSPHPFDFNYPHQAALNTAALYNTHPQLWASAARVYRSQPDVGPTIRALEGEVWGVPKLGWVARFESTEQAEQVLLAAGFRFIPEREPGASRSECPASTWTDDGLTSLL